MHYLLYFIRPQQAPSISTIPPPNHDVDWFFLDIDLKWKLFDWRRCNILENMLHYCNQGQFQIVYKDTLYIVDYEHMFMYHQNDYHKLRRESSILTRPIKPNQGKWSFYNGQTWIQYDKPIQQQLEDLLPQGESIIIMIANNKQYMFDLDQNVQIESIDEKGYNKRKIITRQWMNTHQLQDFGRIKKQQELTYIRERKTLEDYMKMNSQMARKKAKAKKPQKLSDLGIQLKDENQFLNAKQKQQPSQQQQQQQQQQSQDQEIDQIIKHNFNESAFKLIEAPKVINPKQYQEWSNLIEQMKRENGEEQEGEQ